MPAAHQLEVLRILADEESVSMNENSNGTFVNLTSLTADVVQRLAKYVQYVQDQQDRLSRVEAEKARLQEEFFNGDKETSLVV